MPEDLPVTAPPGTAPPGAGLGHHPAGTPPGVRSRGVAALRAAAGATVAVALDLVLPRTCPGCHAGVPWCDACAATLASRPRAVALPEAAMDRMAALGLPVPPMHALARYTGPVRAAVLAGKERGRRDLPPLLGRALGAALLRLQDAAVVPAGLWLVAAPTRPAAARARGGDPVLVMARAAAGQLARAGRATGVAPCLRLRSGARDSVGLDAAGRAANLAGRIRFVDRGAPADGAAVVLLDDVLTTGATVCGSLAVLRDHGVTVSGVLVLAAVPALRPVQLPRRLRPVSPAPDRLA